MSSYQKKKNDRASTAEIEVYADKPVHNWASHGADCFSYMGVQIDDISFDAAPRDIQIVTNLSYRDRDRNR